MQQLQKTLSLLLNMSQARSHLHSQARSHLLPVTIAERVKQLINRPTPRMTPTVITLQVPTNETQNWHQARCADWLNQIKWVEETPGTEYSCTRLDHTPSGPTNRWAVQQGGTAVPASTSRASTKRRNSALSLVRMCSLPYLSRLHPKAVDAMAKDAQAIPLPRRLEEMSAPDNTAASNTTALIKIDSWAPAELITNQSENDIFHFSTAASSSPQKLKRARTSAMSDAKPEAGKPMTYGDAVNQKGRSCGNHFGSNDVKRKTSMTEDACVEYQSQKQSHPRKSLTQDVTEAVKTVVAINQFHNCSLRIKTVIKCAKQLLGSSAPEIDVAVKHAICEMKLLVQAQDDDQPPEATGSDESPQDDDVPVDDLPHPTLSVCVEDGACTRINHKKKLAAVNTDNGVVIIAMEQAGPQYAKSTDLGPRRSMPYCTGVRAHAEVSSHQQQQLAQHEGPGMPPGGNNTTASEFQDIEHHPGPIVFDHSSDVGDSAETVLRLYDFATTNLLEVVTANLFFGQKKSRSTIQTDLMDLEEDTFTCHNGTDYSTMTISPWPKHCYARAWNKLAQAGYWIVMFIQPTCMKPDDVQSNQWWKINGQLKPMRLFGPTTIRLDSCPDGQRNLDPCVMSSRFQWFNQNDACANSFSFVVSLMPPAQNPEVPVELPTDWVTNDKWHVLFKLRKDESQNWTVRRNAAANWKPQLVLAPQTVLPQQQLDPVMPECEPIPHQPNSQDADLQAEFENLKLRNEEQRKQLAEFESMAASQAIAIEGHTQLQMQLTNSEKKTQDLIAAAKQQSEELSQAHNSLLHQQTQAEFQGAPSEFWSADRYPRNLVHDMMGHIAAAFMLQSVHQFYDPISENARWQKLSNGAWDRGSIIDRPLEILIPHDRRGKDAVIQIHVAGYHSAIEMSPRNKMIWATIAPVGVNMENSRWRHLGILEPIPLSAVMTFDLASHHGPEGTHSSNLHRRIEAMQSSLQRSTDIHASPGDVCFDTMALWIHAADTGEPPAPYECDSDWQNNSIIGGTSAWTIACHFKMRQELPMISLTRNRSTIDNDSAGCPNIWNEYIPRATQAASGECKQWKKNGKCSYGDSCKFHHTLKRLSTSGRFDSRSPSRSYQEHHPISRSLSPTTGQPRSRSVSPDRPPRQYGSRKCNSRTPSHSPPPEPRASMPHAKKPKAAGSRDPRAHRRANHPAVPLFQAQVPANGTITGTQFFRMGADANNEPAKPDATMEPRHTLESCHAVSNGVLLGTTLERFRAIGMPTNV